MSLAFTHTAFTAAASAANALSANGSRKYLSIQPLDGDIYVSIDGTVASVAAGSHKVASGNLLEFFDPFCPAGAISIIRSGGSDVAVTVTEG